MSSIEGVPEGNNQDSIVMPAAASGPDLLLEAGTLSTEWLANRLAREKSSTDFGQDDPEAREMRRLKHVIAINRAHRHSR